MVFLYIIFCLLLPANLFCFIYQEKQVNNYHIGHFGSSHLHQPENNQYKALEEKFVAFLKKVNDQKNNNNTTILVIAETPFDNYHQRSDLLESYNQAITIEADLGATAYLACKYSISLCPGEIPSKDLVEKLCKEFDKNMVYYWFCSRFIYKWYHLSKKERAKNTLGQFVIHNCSDVLPADITFETFKKIHTTLHNTIFNEQEEEKNQRLFKAILNPQKNTVTKRATELRDEYTTQLLQKKLKAGNNLFIVYGSNHQKKHLEALT